MNQNQINDLTNDAPYAGRRIISGSLLDKPFNVNDFQIRTLPRTAGGGYGLYFFANELGDRYWFSDGGHRGMDPHAARRFETSVEADAVRGKLNR